MFASDTTPDVLLSTETIVLTAGRGVRPLYAERMLDAYDRGVDSDRLRVEIEPATGQPPVWAFVSVTNNETQHVTAITP